MCPGSSKDSGSCRAQNPRHCSPRSKAAGHWDFEYQHQGWFESRSPKRIRSCPVGSKGLFARESLDSQESLSAMGLSDSENSAIQVSTLTDSTDYLSWAASFAYPWLQRDSSFAQSPKW